MTRSIGGLLNLKPAAAAIAALFAGGLILGCSNEESYVEGGDFVGDWMLFSRFGTLNGAPDGDTAYYDDPNQKNIISFKPSGEAAARIFLKAANFWVDIPQSAEKTSWRVRNQTIYIREPVYDDSGKTVALREYGVAYTAIGKKLVLTYCGSYEDEGYNHCSYETYTKINLEKLKASLGAIHPYNPKLRGEWVLINNDSTDNDSLNYGYNDDLKRISFDSLEIAQFSGGGGNRYFDDYDGNMRAKGDWYTNGDTLYLLVDERCYDDWYDEIGFIKRCVPKQTAMLPYSVSGSGDTLTVTNNRNHNGKDVWIIR